MWERFSKYMDEHQGDFDGFARKAGFVSARVAVSGNVPTLPLSSTDAPPPKKKPPGQKQRRRGKRRQR